MAEFNRRMSHLVIMALFLVLLAPGMGRASWNVSIDGDARYRFTEREEPEADINIVGASARKTFSDSRGDRFTLFGLVEAEDNFSEVMLHEAYGQYKGPMGAWNVTVGRYTLPWGLLSGFSTSRLLYDMPQDALLGMDVDSGVMVSGVSGAFDYAVSLSQGYGAHYTPDADGHGLGIARIGFVPGYTEEITLGLSAAWGRSVTAHAEDRDMAVSRALAGVDATLYLGRWLARIEVSAGRVDDRAMTAGFAALDYALLPRLDLNLAGNVRWHGSEYEDEWFVGFTGKPPWFTIRGGYTYAPNSASEHEVSFQLYRLFSFDF